MKTKIEKVEEYIKQCKYKMINLKRIDDLSLSFKVDMFKDKIEKQNLHEAYIHNIDLNSLIQKLSHIEDKIKIYDNILTEINNVYGEIKNYADIVKISRHAYDVYKYIEASSNNGILIEDKKDIFKKLNLSDYLIKKNIKILQEYGFIRTTKKDNLIIYVIDK